MKRSVTPFIFLFAFIGLTQNTLGQWGVGMGYVYSDPMNAMGLDIDRSHGLRLSIAYQIPHSKFEFLTEANFSLYGNETFNRDFSIDGETFANMEMNVVNLMTTYNLSGRYYLLSNNASVEPYVQIHAGVSVFNTRLTIDDPREEYTSDCPKPLVSDLLTRDATFVSGVGLGSRIHLTKKEDRTLKGSIFLDVQASYLAGGNVSYMVVDEPGKLSAQNQSGRDEISLEFASEAQPEVIHEYHTGYLYTNPMQMMNFNITLGFINPIFLRNEK